MRQSDIGGEVRRLRRSMGMSQESLAAQAGCSVPWLSNVERGNKAPSIELLRRIAAVLQVAPSELGLDVEAAKFNRKRAPAEANACLQDMDEDALQTALAQLKALHGLVSTNGKLRRRR